MFACSATSLGLQSKVCIGRKWQSLLPSLTLPPFQLMGSQEDKFKESSGA